MLISFHFRTDHFRILLVAFFILCLPALADVAAGYEFPPPGLPSNECSDYGERDSESFDESDSFQDDALYPHRAWREPMVHGFADGQEHCAKKVLEITGYYTTSRPPPPR